VLISLAIVADVALSATAMGGYVPGGATLGDNAAPGLYALVHGNLAAYAAHQPVIGLTSMLLRVPAAEAVRLFGGGPLLTYQIGALVCLVPLALFAAWLAAGQPALGQSRVPRVVAALVLVLSPVLRDTLSAGHPEDVLTAVLVTASVIAAARERAGWAAVMLGLAVGCKPWGLIAVAPVLIALPGQRVFAAVLGGVIAVLLAGAAPLADPAAFVRALHGEAHTNLVNPLSLWWPLSSSFHLPTGQLADARMLPVGLSRAQASLLALMLAAPLVIAGCARGVRRGESFDPLALLTLLALLLCACDSTHLAYYYFALLVPLATWEAISLGRLPWMAVTVTVAVALIPDAFRAGNPTAVWVGSTAGTLALIVFVSRNLLVTDRGPTLPRWVVPAGGRVSPT
jgi:hypothetical protein